MTRILLSAAALGLGLSAASACDYMKSVKADTTATTVVASADKQQVPPMSTPATPAPAEAKTQSSATSAVTE